MVGRLHPVNIGLIRRHRIIYVGRDVGAYGADRFPITSTTNRHLCASNVSEYLVATLDDETGFAIGVVFPS